ncbi:MAG: hypothetical protein QXG26_02720 [Candidatus Aenigmatarchaeota archaeon]
MWEALKIFATNSIIMVEYKSDNYDAILAIYASDEHIPKIMQIVKNFPKDGRKIFPLELVNPEDGCYYFGYKGDAEHAFKLLDNIRESGAHKVFYKKITSNK